ncbi:MULTISPECIES: zinc-dependent metalloprotease [Flavobacterium]|nr:zinc-dependent metalloprotease [Flavobacterium sp. N1846]
MKKLFLKSMPFMMLTSFLLTSCQQDDVIDDKTDENKTLTVNANDPQVVKLLEMGFKLVNIKEFDDYYLVENDMIFYKNENYNQKQAHGNRLVYMDKVNTMTVKIDNSIPATGNWRQAITNAVNDWNNIADCRIIFSITTNTTADIYVVNDPSISSPLIAALPYGGNPGSQIKINLNHSSLIDLPESGRKRAVMHELGHTIGFVHSNGIANGEGNSPNGYITIPNTPYGGGIYIDADSVMNSSLTTAIGFSSYDLIASKYLYPDTYSINDLITFPVEGTREVNGGGGLHAYWKASYIPSANVKIEVFKEGILKQTLIVPNTGFSYYDTFSSGFYKVKISSETNPNLYDEVNFEYFMD